MIGPADAVVLGSSPTGLYAIREIAGAGLKVALADISKGCAFESRHVRQVSQSFVGTLEDLETWLIERPATDVLPVLIPTSDFFIEFVMRRFGTLSRTWGLAGSYAGIAERLLDKASFHALCAEHDVATPGVWLAHDRTSLSELVDTVPYPCILKPALIHRAKKFLRGKKVLIAKSADEYAQHLAAIPKDGGSWLVQEIIPGPESEISLFGGYIDSNHEPQQAFTGRKLRQYPAGFGSASLVTSKSCNETLDLSLSFLRAIGFQGVCGTEYKRDPRDGRLKIIEINPRPTLWFQATHDAGKRIVEAAVRDLQSGARITDCEQREDVRWRYGLKDIASGHFYSRHKGDFIFPPPDTSGACTGLKRSWAVYSPDDPLPALSEPFGYLRKAWSRYS